MKNTITEFTKGILQNVIRRDLVRLLDAYSEETGIEFHVGNMRFDSTTLDIKVQGRIAGVIPAGLKQAAKFAGLSLEPVNGKRLIDYKRANHKYPFIYEESGKRYKCSNEQANFHFRVGRNTAA